MMCNFGDAEKIKTMLKEKYVDGDTNFDVKETRSAFSSLNDICISEKNGETILTLEPTTDGYIITNTGKFVLLEFVGDIYNCLTE